MSVIERIEIDLSQSIRADTLIHRDDLGEILRLAKLAAAAEEIIKQIVCDCAKFQDLLLSIETHKKVSELYWDFCKLRKEA